MTIDNLEAIVSPSSEDLLLIRHGGKEWKYPLSTLASNLINDPTISAATLGTASHPFKTANITTLNVGGSGTVNGNLTVQATADTTTSALLKVEKTLTVKGDTTVSGTLSTKAMTVDSNTKATNLYVANLQKDKTSEPKIPNVYVSESLTSKTLNATTAVTADYLHAENIGTSDKVVDTVKVDNLYATNLGTKDSPITTVYATDLTSKSLSTDTTNATTFNPNTLNVTNTASITDSDPVNGSAFTSGSLSVKGKTTVGNLKITDGTATITNGFSAKSLEITDGGTATISGNVKAGSLNVTNDLTVATLTGKDSGNITKVAVSGTLKVNNLTATGATLTVDPSEDNSISVGTLTLGTSAALNVTSSLTLQSLKASKSTLTASSGDIKTSAITASNLSSLELADSGILKLKSLTASASTLTADSGDIGTSSITASALSSLTVSDSITAKALSMTDGTLTVKSDGKVTVGSSSSTSSESDSSSSGSKYFMTKDSIGNIIAPSLVLMADTTADLTEEETNPLVITSVGASIGNSLYTAGYLPNTECMIAGSPSDTDLDNYGYLLTVTGGLRVGRSTDKYDKTPDGQTKLPGSYSTYVTAINKDGTISSGCTYKCYGTVMKTDSEGNETTEEGFLTSEGTIIPVEDYGDLSDEEREEILFTSVGGAIKTVGSIVSKSPIMGSKVFNAVWNDLADCIPVNKEAVIEPGYCYCFDGEKYYKSTKYLEKGIIGIESDTYGMHMGSKPGVKQMDVAVSGFALAYVDKEYESGTPLTCTENGYLTEIAKQDKIEYPERIVGTYWKPEPNEEWGSSDRKVKVNGRHWIKIK